MAFDGKLRDNGAAAFDGQLSDAENQTIILADFALAGAVALAPTISGAVTITPNAAVASGIALNPTLTPGESTITPAPAVASGISLNPTLTPGAITITLGGTAIASGIALTSSILGQITLTPAPASANAVALAPTLTVGNVTLTLADVATASGTILTPLLSPSVTLSPAPAVATASVIDAVISSVVSPLALEVDITDAVYGVNSVESCFIVNGEVVDAIVTIIANGIHLYYRPPNAFDYKNGPIKVIVHAVNGNVVAPVVKDQEFILYYGYEVVHYNNHPFEHLVPVNVFVSAKNKYSNFKYLDANYFFTTYSNPSSELAASITAIRPIADLNASITAVAPEHRYGETVVVELFLRDFAGNELGPYTFSYTIEDRT